MLRGVEGGRRNEGARDGSPSAEGKRGAKRYQAVFLGRRGKNGLGRWATRGHGEGQIEDLWVALAEPGSVGGPNGRSQGESCGAVGVLQKWIWGGKGGAARGS